MKKKNNSGEYARAYKYKLISLFFLSVFISSCDSDSNKTIVDFSDRIASTEAVQPEKKTGNNIYYFGFDLRASPKEDSRQYLPFLKYLSEATGYQFELRFTPKNSSIIDELGTGNIDIAAMGAVSFIEGNIKYGIKSLVRGLNKSGKAEYQSMIVVNSKNKDITGIHDLVNSNFAFGSESSTQGHLIPRIILYKNGITLGDLKSFKYTGSHQNCANAVISQQFDACGMQDTMAKAMKNKGLVKILYTSKYFPSSGIAVNKNMSVEASNKIKQALLDFDPLSKHKENLYNWSKTEMPNGFTSAEQSDYQYLTDWLYKLKILQ